MIKNNKDLGAVFGFDYEEELKKLELKTVGQIIDELVFRVARICNMSTEEAIHQIEFSLKRFPHPTKSSTKLGGK